MSLRRGMPGVLVIATAAVVGCVQTEVPAAAPAGPWAAPVSSEAAVETFDSAWSRISATYYDSTFRGVDWAEVRGELRPRAEAAETVGELRKVIRSMLNRLGESHFVLIPGEIADGILTEDGEAARGEVGLELRWIDESVVVTRVAPGGSAETEGVRPGWVLESAAGRDLAEVMEVGESDGDARVPGVHLRMIGAALELLGGEPGTAVPAAFRDGSGRRVMVELQRRPPAGEPVRLGNLPTTFAHAEHERVPLGRGACAGVIRFNTWMVPLTAKLVSAVDEVSDCAGVVIDLRGNMGGVVLMISGITGVFLDEPVRLGTMRTRASDLRLVANPRRATQDGRPTRPYAGAVAILVDDWTMSASEMFTAGLQWTGRARVFGVPTAGEALPSHVTRLPNGDVMMHVIANFELPDGRRVEGDGVIPDQHVEQTRTDLLAGKDRPLDAALEWIRAAGSVSAAQDGRSN